MIGLKKNMKNLKSTCSIIEEVCRLVIRIESLEDNLLNMNMDKIRKEEVRRVIASNKTAISTYKKLYGN